MLNRGDILDNTYQIINEIGNGGGGIVYKAIHLRLQKYVAVKKVRDNVLDIINIRGEADILKNLKHAYLPQVYDFLQIDQQIYTIIEFIPGEPLSHYLNKKYRFYQKDIIKWAKQLCEALVYLHSQNPPIIHSDIKPGNIMITPSHDICLIDFNISLNSDRRKYSIGVSAGYASPEHYSDSAHRRGAALDVRSDIYSLGATLYHMLTGIKPAETLNKLIPLEQFNLDYSESLLRIVSKAMNPDIRSRYQTAGEMLKDLNSIHKLDKRYKKQRRQEYLSTILGVMLITIFLATSYVGYNRMGLEKVERYESMVMQGKEYVYSGDYEDALRCYDQAILMFNDRLAAYYEKIYLLSAQRDYDQVISLAQAVLSNTSLYEELVSSKTEYADIEYMLANAYFEQEDYSSAAEYYSKAVDLNQTNYTYYRDYAIALVRIDNLNGASAILNEASELGLTQDSICLVEAELALKQGNYAQAVNKFKEAISTSSDVYLKQRAYILCAEAFRSTNDIDNEIAVLEEGRATVDAGLLNNVIVSLGEAYARKAKQSPEYAKEYNQKAVECYETLISSGDISYNTRMNLVTLYQTLEQYSDAEELLTMLETEYPNDYKVHMRYALLLCQIESEKDSDLRDYHNAEKYYLTAAQLYSDEQVSGKSDSEMQMLESVMAQLYEGNWLEK